MLSENLKNHIKELKECGQDYTAEDFETWLSDIKQLESDKAELQKALISFVKCSCYACPDGVENPNEEECRGCGYYDYIKLLEKQFNKSWEEIKDLKWKNK